MNCAGRCGSFPASGIGFDGDGDPASPAWRAYTVVAGLTDAEEVVVNTATITVPAEVGDPIAGNNRSVNRSSSSVPVYLPVISNRR